MAQKYANKTMNEKRARAMVRDARVSPKQAIEVCNFVKGKPLQKAKTQLDLIMDHKKALPMRRYIQEGAGHRKGKVGPGRFPEKTASEMHDLLSNVESNAQYKGLDTSRLKIVHICANKGGNQPRYGRSKRGIMKRSNVEVIVEEVEPKEKQSGQQKAKQEGSAQKKTNKDETDSAPAQESNEDQHQK